MSAASSKKKERDKGQRPISSFFFSKPKAGDAVAGTPSAPPAPLTERGQAAPPHGIYPASKK